MENPNKQMQKQKSKLYVAMIQDEDGTIQQIKTNINYDHLWLEITTESKAARGFWTIFNVTGQFIDGNFRSKVTK